MASEVVLYLVGVRLRLRLRDSSRMAPGRGAVMALYMFSCASRAMISKILGREAYTSPATTASKLPSRWPHLGVAGRRRVGGNYGTSSPRGRSTTGDLGRGPQRPQAPWDHSGHGAPSGSAAGPKCVGKPAAWRGAQACEL